MSHEWRMHADKSPLFAEYLLLAGEAGWDELVSTEDLAIGRGDILIVEDMQNDFVEIDQLNPQGGAFAVAEGSTICPQIVRLVEHFATCGGEVVLTRSYHPKQHCSFIPQQGPFPPHCVQGTVGSFFYEPIAACIQKLYSGDAPYKDQVKIAFKGFHEDVDSLGSFEYPDEQSSWERIAHAAEPNERMLHGYPLASWTGAVLLDCSNQATDVNAPPDIMSVLRRESLKSWLRHRGTNRIFVCGLAMDLCVLDTAINAVSAGFRHIHMVMDASRATHLPSMGKFGTGFLTDPASIQQKLKAAGVTVVPTAALLPGFLPYNPVGEKEMLKYGFPKTLGPFALVRCRKLALFVDREKRTYKAKAPLEEIRQLEANGMSASGTIATPSPMTLSDEVKKMLGIPVEAVQFCWAYPVGGGKWSEQALAYFSITTPSSAFFVYGGYIYFDKRGRVVAMCAISLGNGLIFEPGRSWDHRFSGALEGRWVRVTVPYILDKGGRYFAWVNGGEVLQPPCKEVLGGDTWQAPPNGCFVYLFSESPTLADDRDVYFAVATEQQQTHKCFGRVGVSEEETVNQLRRLMGGEKVSEVSIGKVQKALQEWDANLDGRISEDEMTAVLKTLNPKITPESMRRLFSQADLNKDGAIDVEEFVKWLWPADGV
ncbi:CML24 [Symbiodinium sp. KB8]|nr:CML24 [Symbiodinium sp. KB8]